MHPIVRTIACGILLLALPACGIPPRRQAQPAPPLPQSFVGVTSPLNSSRLGVAEFYQDPLLVGLIEQARANNRELKILEEEVQIASNEILSRSGAYLPFMTAGPEVGLERFSDRVLDGAALKEDEFVPGKFFKNPHANYLMGTMFTWQVDIYRQLRNARDAAAQRYVAAIERRNAFMIGMVAEIAENYYQLMALDKRLENLDQIIAFQEQSLEVARASMEFVRADATQLGILRFEAAIRGNQSEKQIILQDIIEAENRINVLAYRYPQPVGRNSAAFYDLQINTLGVGVPSELLQNRPDIRQAERELFAAGLDVEVARVNFYPQLILSAGVGLNSFNMAGLFTPAAVAGNVVSGFVGPLVNRRAIKADFLSSNARQVQTIYDYQRTILEAFTEVVNRLTEVQNYSRSVEIRKQQLTSLENAVNVADQLYQFTRIEYLDVLTAQQDLRDARLELIDTKEQELIAVVRAYQALGGGTMLTVADREKVLHPIPSMHHALGDQDFRALSRLHFGSGRYFKALRASLQGIVPYRNRLNARAPHPIPPGHPAAPGLIQESPATAPALPMAQPADESGLPPALPPVPPPADEPGPFPRPGTEDPSAEATGDAESVAEAE